MTKQYHYLVSSLPELSFTPDDQQYDFVRCKAFITEDLLQSDVVYIDLLCRPIDNKNIINSLFNTGIAWEKGGAFTQDQFLADRQSTGAYYDKFWKFWDEQDVKNGLDQMHTERYLLEHFYNTCKKTNNKFIQEWFRFDAEINNLKAVFASQKINRPFQEHLLGNDTVAEFYKNNATINNASLALELEYVDAFTKIMATENLLEREKQIDVFRWQVIEEMITFDYFSINTILAFLQKAKIINRWVKMDAANGQKRFKQLVDHLKGEYVSA